MHHEGNGSESSSLHCGKLHHDQHLLLLLQLQNHLQLFHLFLSPHLNHHNHSDVHRSIALPLQNSAFLFLYPASSDPSVSRYHVQWMPEFCSHNETRGPEKSVTQVRLRRFFAALGKRGAQLKKTAPRGTQRWLIAGCRSECYESAVRSSTWCVGTIKRHLP